MSSNMILRGLTLLCATIKARYYTYSEEVRVLITISDEVKEVSKEIGRYEGKE